MNKSTTMNYRQNKISILLIITILIYILFAFKRIKFSFASEIDGVALINAIWLFPIVFVWKHLLSSKSNTSINKVALFDSSFLLLFIGLIIVILFGGFEMYIPSQYIYAILQFIVPMIFIFSISLYDLDYSDYFIKSLVLCCLIYSVMAIIASNNYGFLMELLGNKTSYQYYSQYRASLMLGSSITVSYYLNLTLPICFFMNYTCKEKKWKILSLVTILLNLLATAILLSRLAFFISIFITIYYLLFVRSNQLSIFKKIGIIILIIIVAVNVINTFNLSRLFMGFGDASTLGRFSALNLGIHIFKQRPIFGAGMGRFFIRAYSDPFIVVDGIRGLVDPHNTYILLLSEIGIVGFIIFALIFIKVISSFKYIKDNSLRKTAYIVVFAYLLGSFGGSQLINEINFSTLFWIYISFFRAVGIRDYILRKSLTKQK